MKPEESGYINLRIKNMVCDRCIEKVGELLDASGFKVDAVELGHVRVEGENGEWNHLKTNLLEAGFELVEDEARQRVERIKAVLINHINDLQNQTARPDRLSTILTAHIPWHYEGLSRSFKQVTGITIERYFILLKIEKVKELLEYGELTLSQIADRLGYSSSQHLSGQFKKETGVSVSEYRKDGLPERKSLSEVGS